MFLAFFILILPLIKCQGPHANIGSLDFGGREAIGNTFHPQDGILSGGHDINYGLGRTIETGIDSSLASGSPTGHFDNVAVADNVLAIPGPGIDLTRRGPGPGIEFDIVGGSPLGIFRGSTQVEKTSDKPDTSVGKEHGRGIRFGDGGSGTQGSLTDSVFHIPDARSSDSYGSNYDLERGEGSLVDVSGIGRQGSFDFGGKREPVGSGTLSEHKRGDGYSITSNTEHEPDKVYLIYNRNNTIGQSGVIGRSQSIDEEIGLSYFDSHRGLSGNQAKSDLGKSNYDYQTSGEYATVSDYIDDVGSEFGNQEGDIASGQNRRQYEEVDTNEFELGVADEVYESIPQYFDETGEGEFDIDYDIKGEENDYTFETVYDDWVEDNELSDTKYKYGPYDPYDYSSSTDPTEDYDIKTIYIDLKDSDSIPAHYSDESLVDNGYNDLSNSFSGFRDHVHDNGTDDHGRENGQYNGTLNTENDDDDKNYERREHDDRRRQRNGHRASSKHHDRTKQRYYSDSNRREHNRERYGQVTDDTRYYFDNNNRREHRHGHDSAREYSDRESFGQDNSHGTSREHSEHHDRRGYGADSIRKHSAHIERIGHDLGDRRYDDRKDYGHISDSRREHDEDDNRRGYRHGHGSTRGDIDREERTGYGQSYDEGRELSEHHERKGNDHGRNGRREYDEDDDRSRHRHGHDSARQSSERKRSGQLHSHGIRREHSEHYERRGHGHGHASITENTERISHDRGDRREHERRGLGHVSDSRREYNEDDYRIVHHHGHSRTRENIDREEKTGHGDSHDERRDHSKHHESRGNNRGHGGIREHSEHAEKRGHGHGGRRQHDRKRHVDVLDSRNEYDEDDDRRGHNHRHGSTRQDMDHSQGSTMEHSEHEEKREFRIGHDDFREARERTERREHDRLRHSRDRSDENDDSIDHFHGVTRGYHGHDEMRRLGGRRDNDGYNHIRSLSVGHVGTTEHDERTHARRHDHSQNSTRINLRQDDRQRNDHDRHTDRRQHGHDHQTDRRGSDNDHHTDRRRNGHDHRTDRRGNGNDHRTDRRQHGHDHRTERRGNGNDHHTDRRHHGHDHRTDRRGNGNDHHTDRRHHGHDHRTDRRGNGNDHHTDRQGPDHIHHTDRRGRGYGRRRDRRRNGHDNHTDRRQHGYDHRTDRRGHGHDHHIDGRGHGHDHHTDRRGKGHDHHTDRRGKGHDRRTDKRRHGHDHRIDRRQHGHGHHADRQGNDHHTDRRGKGHERRTDRRRHGHGHHTERRGKGHDHHTDRRGKGHGRRTDKRRHGHDRRIDRRQHGHDHHTDRQGNGNDHHTDRQGHGLDHHTDTRGHGHDHHTVRREHGRDHRTHGRGGLNQHNNREYRRRNGNSLGDRIAQRHGHFKGKSHDRGRSSYGHGHRREQYAQDYSGENDNVYGETETNIGHVYRERQSQSHSRVNNDDRRALGQRQVETDRGIFDLRQTGRRRGKYRNLQGELRNHGSSYGGRNEHHGHETNGRGRVEQNGVRGSFHSKRKYTNTGRKPRYHRHPIRKGDRRPKKKTHPRRRLIKVVIKRRRPLLKTKISSKTKRIQQRPTKYIARSQMKKPFVYRPKPTIKQRPKPLYYQKFGQYLKKYRLQPASRRKPSQKHKQKQLVPRKMKRPKDNPKKQKGLPMPHYYFNSHLKHVKSGLDKTEASKKHEQTSLHTKVMPQPIRFLYTHGPPYYHFPQINFR